MPSLSLLWEDSFVIWNPDRWSSAAMAVPLCTVRDCAHRCCPMSTPLKRQALWPTLCWGLLEPHVGWIRNKLLECREKPVMCGATAFGFPGVGDLPLKTFEGFWIALGRRKVFTHCPGFYFDDKHPHQVVSWPNLFCVLFYTGAVSFFNMGRLTNLQIFKLCSLFEEQLHVYFFNTLLIYFFSQR